MTDKPADPQPGAGTAAPGPEASPPAAGPETAGSSGRRAARKEGRSGLPWKRRKARPAGPHPGHRRAQGSAAPPDVRAAAPAAAPGAGARTAGGSALRRPLGIAAGVGLLAVVAAAAAAGSMSGTGSAAAEVPAVSAAVAAGNFTGVCPEPLKLLDSAAGQTDPEFSPVSDSARTRARAVVVSDLGGRVPGSRLAVLGSRKPLVTIARSSGTAAEEARGSSEDGQTKLLAAVVSAQRLTAPTVLTVQPVAGRQALAGAAMTYSAADGDLRGLAAANCTAPANDFWLLGAATTVGAAAVLNLHNPTQTPATVDLELLGADGPVQAAGARGLLLAPGESRSIVLGGLAAKQDALAVHVSTSGGAVSGTIQQSILRGLTPGGVELLTPSAGPSLQQVVTGVQIQAEELSRTLRGRRGYGSASPALDVVVPGGQDASLQVRVFGEDGEVRLPGGGDLTAAAGSVTRVPLESLPAGTYTVQVSSDVSMAAAVRLSRGTGRGEPVDFGWSPAVSRLGSEHLAIVPGGTESRLVFAAPSKTAEVKLVPVDRGGNLGKERVVKVPAGTTVTVDPQARGADTAAVMVGATGDAVYGAQVLSGPDGPGIAVLPVPDGGQGRQSVPVHLGY